MDYKHHYDKLIEKAKNRIIPNDIYSERHHIIPKCLGGNNSKTNIVRLLPKEHYIAHLLLFNLHPNNQSLAYSFWMMSNGNKKDKRTYRVSGKIYEEIRSRFSSIMKQRKPFFQGKAHTEESKKKNRDAHIGNPGTWIGRTHSEESKIKMSKKAMGKKVSVETREKMSKSKSGVKLSYEHREKLSKSNMGENNNYKRYLEKTGLPHHASKTVIQYSLDGKFIREWVNARIACIELGISYGAVNGCLNGKSKTSQGFIWKYK
jgi:hypothetical protein